MSNVFLFAGQSNADGRAYHSAGYVLPSFIHYEARPLWPELSGSHQDDVVGRLYGAEYNFARAVHAFTGETVNIVKVALGGVPLAQRNAADAWIDWSPESRGEMFDALTVSLSGALSAMKINGDEPHVKGMLWMQGETDVRSDLRAAKYREHLEDFFEKLYLASPALTETKIGIGRIAEDYFSGIPDRVSAMNLVQSAQEDFVNDHENSFLINTNSFEMNSSDPIHYAEAGYNDLGLAFAAGIYGKELEDRVFNASGYLEINGDGKIALMGSARDEVRSFSDNTRVMLGDGSDRAYIFGKYSKVWGESGNDVVSIGNSSSHVDGGQGVDIVFVRNSMTIRSGALVDVEKIHLAAGVKLNASASDVHYFKSYSTSTQGVWMIATSGSDELIGNIGKDTLNGGSGVDSMSGGDGDDTYFVDSPDDVVVEVNSVAGVGGVDIVYSFLDNYTLTANVENGRIKGSGTAVLTGNDLNNRLYAGLGNNTLKGGLGTDTVSYAYGVTGTMGVTVDIADTAPQATGGSGLDTLIGIENLTGSKNDDRLTGDSGTNSLNGGGGNDTLMGGVGKDYLTGGAGSDVFVFKATGETGITSASWDVVRDFSTGLDKIDLSGIFANVNTASGDKSVSLVVGSGFSGHFKNPGDDLYFDKEHHILYGNTNDDARFEFAIRLMGVSVLEDADFIF